MISSFFSAPGSLVVLVVTVAISLIALFVYPNLLSQFIFRPYEVTRNKKYDALYMSGFIHASVGHLALNMLSFCFFGFTLEHRIGTLAFVGLYFLGLIVSVLPSWYAHRDDPNYATMGASGAVSAVIFAYVVYFPGASLFIMPLPFPIPAPVYAVGYVAYSWYSAKRAQDNINHSAHITGAIFGIAYVIIFDNPVFFRFLDSFSQILS